MIPSREECLKIMHDNGAPEHLIAHCEAVEALALEMAGRCAAGMELVSAGALLHDLGRCRTNGIDHAVAGAEMARELGISEDVVAIIETHIGAGISAKEAVERGLPEKDYTPVSLEAKIVAHADNLIGEVDGIPVRRTLADVIAKMEGQGHPKAATRVASLHRELESVFGIDPDNIAVF